MQTQQLELAVKDLASNHNPLPRPKSLLSKHHAKMKISPYTNSTASHLSLHLAGLPSWTRPQSRFEYQNSDRDISKCLNPTCIMLDFNGRGSHIMAVTVLRFQHRFCCSQIFASGVSSPSFSWKTA